VPFQKVYLHGLVKDPYGKRMSKTKGNVVDPLEAIDTAGADALRFALLNGTSPGNDQKFQPGKLEDGRNFANKLWNATRFVIGARPASIAPGAGRRPPDESALGPAERWIRSRAAAAVGAVDRAFAADNYGEVTRLLYDAIWGEFCDWGLELAKVRLADQSLSAAEREATWWTLVEALDTYLRLLHPVMPFVTEALWGTFPRPEDESELLIVARWPQAGPRDEALEADLEAVSGLITGIRNARAEAGIDVGARLAATLVVAGDLAATVAALRPAIERLARVAAEVRPDDVADGERPGTLTVLGRGISAVLTPERDPEALARERGRLEKELGQAERLLSSARARLADAAFVERAPAAIVEGARSGEAELAERVEHLRARLA